MKANMLKVATLASILILSTACGKKAELNEDVVIADSVEAAITALAGAADEQSDSEFAAYKSTPEKKVLDALNILNPLQTAQAAVCFGRAVGQACNSGVRSKTYSLCNIIGTAQTINGSVSLNYSDNSCDFSQVNQSLTRTFDVTRKTPWGAEIRVFSDDHTDFEGNTYGGGGKITRLASGFNIEVLGKHKTRTNFLGREALDISLKTSSPVHFNKLLRNGRIVDGGALVIAHNLANYKVTLQPSQLTYSTSCCYPVGGSITATYEGVIDGSGTVIFTGCGQATISRDDNSYPIEFNSCE